MHPYVSYLCCEHKSLLNSQELRFWEYIWKYTRATERRTQRWEAGEMQTKLEIQRAPPEGNCWLEPISCRNKLQEYKRLWRDTLQVRGVLLRARTSLPWSSCMGRCFLSHCHLCLQNNNMHQSHSSDSWVQPPVPHSVAPKYNCTTDNLAQRPESCKAHHKVLQFSRKLRHELARPMTPGNPQWENPNKILKSGNAWQFGAYIFMHHNCQAPDHRKPRSFSSGTCLLAFPETYFQRAALPETHCS